MQKKLKQLPTTPGVYFFKDADKKIIYIGKAAVLRNRVRQYFQSSKHHDTKTKLLVDEIVDIDWIETESEVDALFLEGEMIKRYMPKYNIELRDDKHWSYVRINMKDKYPTVSVVRRPLDDGARYFGPYTEAIALRKALKILRKVFPYSTHRTLPKRVCLQYHLGLCPGVEEEKTSEKDYKRNLRRLIMYLRGRHKRLIRELEQEMKRASKSRDFERAAKLRDQVNQLKSLSRQKLFGEQEAYDISKDQALQGLSSKLGLQGLPRRIECYDISHTQGVDTTASMVVFTDGVANRGEYRKFKMRTPGNDDYAHMREVMTRRFSKRNLESWPKPDLIVIDGGKGQVRAALEAMTERSVHLPVIGLAKRLETVYQPDLRDRDLQAWLEKSEFVEIFLPYDSHVLKLLQRIRDEAHRFAVTYHASLRSKRQTNSLLESVPGIGPKTRKKLIRHFGSLKGVLAASDEELQALLSQQQLNALRQTLGHNSSG